MYETKFKPIPPKKTPQIEVLKPERLAEENPKNILIEDFFVQNSAEDLELITKINPQPLTLTSTSTTTTTTTEAPEEYKENPPVISPEPKVLPKLLRPKKQTVHIPLYHVSISDELSGADSYHQMFASNGEEAGL